MKREEFGLYRDYGLFIDGAWRPAADGGAREVIDPANEEILGWIPVAGQADLDAALASARRGFEVWRRKSPWDRAAVLRKTADLIRSRERGDRPADVAGDRQAAGRRPAARRGTPPTSSSGTPAKPSASTARPSRAALPEVRMQIRYEPVGVVAAFSAWNFPALLPSRKIAAALGAGCSIIVKPASEAAGSCMAVVQALHDAGLPGRRRQPGHRRLGLHLRISGALAGGGEDQPDRIDRRRPAPVASGGRRHQAGIDGAGRPCAGAGVRGCRRGLRRGTMRALQVPQRRPGVRFAVALLRARERLPAVLRQVRAGRQQPQGRPRPGS